MANKSWLLGLLGLAALFFGGCASTPSPRSYDVSIELDPSLATGSVQLDIIGANGASDLPKLQSYPVSDYWQPGDRLRRDSDKVVFQFGQGKPPVQVFAITDPIWKRWLNTGALYLVVLVDLPGAAPELEGNADPRRLILPLDSREWPNAGKGLQLRIQASGIRLLTPKKEK